MEKHTYHLISGSNLGDRLHQLRAAKSMIQEQVGHVTKESQVYETQPWGFDEQPWFLNQAFEVVSFMEPLELLDQLKQIETDLGRMPGEKWHARHLDLDILLCGDMIFHHPRLILPHPHLQERNFVLVPLMEIAATLIHPVFQKNIAELYAECRDIGEVYIFNADEQGNPL